MDDALGERRGRVMAEHRRQQKERWAKEREENETRSQQRMADTRKRSVMTAGMWPLGLAVSHNIAPALAGFTALPVWVPYLTVAATFSLFIGTVGRDGGFASRLYAARWIAFWTTVALGVFVLLGAGPEA